ncbi:unnamed protein product [Trichogramma brassicae]|uniref:Uncharacterized protein n=1 Tax=Trichogramma brassicae TaxID=86971 RepID=A0A6H5INY4_9HYME|nr:unnamed protein product [Trichogramma brassicae]
MSRKEQKRYRVALRNVYTYTYVRRKSIARFIVLARAATKKIRSSISSCDTEARERAMTTGS